MGEVKVQAKLGNFSETEAVRKGYIPSTDTAGVEIEMLVDTGAVLVFLPQDIVERLDLAPGGRVIVTYADERREERPTARGLEITINGRTMVTDCIIGPPLSEPLLGQMVLEELDLVVDCGRKTLTVRPESPHLPLLKLKRG